MRETPHLTLEDEFADDLECAICGEVSLKVHHVENLPDYVACKNCGSAFLVEQSDERVLYGQIAEEYKDTKKFALGQWAWPEAIARRAALERPEREEPAEDISLATTAPFFEVPDSVMPLLEQEESWDSETRQHDEESLAAAELEEGIDDRLTLLSEPSDQARVDLPEEAEGGLPIERELELTGEESEDSPVPEAEPTERMDEIQESEADELPHGTGAQEELAGWDGPVPDPTAETQPEEIRHPPAGEDWLGEPLTAEHPIAELDIEEEETRFEAAEEQAEPTDTGQEPEATPQEGPLKTATPQPAPGEPPPGERHQVTLRGRALIFPDEVCAHCTRAPIRGRLAILGALPDHEKQGLRKRTTFQLPLCADCLGRAGARSEEQRSARLQAHLFSGLFALLLAVCALSFRLVSFQESLATDLLILSVLAIAGYGLTLLVLLNRASRMPPPADAIYVRSTLVVSGSKDGVDTLFQWRSRGYAERFQLANADNAVGSIIPMRESSDQPMRTSTEAAIAEDGTG